MYLTATDLGRRCGITAKEINFLLESCGFQKKQTSHGKPVWVPTKEGRRYAHVSSVGRIGGFGEAVYSYRWDAAVIEELKVSKYWVITTDKNRSPGIKNKSDADLEELLRRQALYETEQRACLELYNKKKKVYDDCEAHFLLVVRGLNESLIGTKNEYEKLKRELMQYQYRPKGIIERCFSDCIEVTYCDFLPAVGYPISCSTARFNNRPEVRDLKNKLNQQKEKYDEILAEIIEFRKSLVPSAPTQSKPNIPKTSFTVRQIEAEIERRRSQIIQERAIRNRQETHAAIISEHYGTQRQLAARIKREIANQFKLSPNCPYCNILLDRKTAHADHIYPIAKGGRNISSNMVYVCQPCNSSKGTMLLRTFIRRMNFNRKEVEARLDLLKKDF